MTDTLVSPQMRTRHANLLAIAHHLKTRTEPVLVSARTDCVMIARCLSDSYAFV